MLTVDKTIQALVTEARERLMEAGADSVVILTTRYDRVSETTNWYYDGGGNVFANREIAGRFATGALLRVRNRRRKNDPD